VPYVNIKITREGATAEQKAELIRGVTELLRDKLGKNPRRRWSSSRRSTPTAGGSAASRSPSADAAGAERAAVVAD
jgi:hypothetical protein